MSIWKKPLTNAAAYVEPVPCIIGNWEEDDFSLEFTIEEINGDLRATAFTLLAPDGLALTGSQRRLPTDAQLVDALVGKPEGARLTVWLADTLTDVIPDGATASTLSRTQLDAAMDDRVQSLPRRRSTRPGQAQIRKEVEWLKEEIVSRRDSGNYTTSDLIARFTGRFWVSKPTAYRRLKQANEELGRGK